jgi:hypothetical protein
VSTTPDGVRPLVVLKPEPQTSDRIFMARTKGSPPRDIEVVDREGDDRGRPRRGASTGAFAEFLPTVRRLGGQSRLRVIKAVADEADIWLIASQS